MPIANAIIHFVTVGLYIIFVDNAPIMIQDYKHHVRYYAPHHFIFYPIVLTLAGVATGMAIQVQNQALLWGALASAFFLLACFSFMVRQHYALTLQNRMVKLEMRYRYFALTQERLEPFEQQLTFGQIAALRFASDDELPTLIQQTIQLKLAPEQIKQSIKNWNPDWDRV